MPLYENCLNDKTVCGPDEFCDPGGSLCQSCRVMCTWQFRKRCEKLCKNSTYYPAKPPDQSNTQSLNKSTTPKLYILLSTITVLPRLVPEKVLQSTQAITIPPTISSEKVANGSTDQLVLILVICFIIIAFLLGLITAVLVYLLRKIRNRSLQYFYEDTPSSKRSSQTELIPDDIERQRTSPQTPKLATEKKEQIYHKSADATSLLDQG